VTFAILCLVACSAAPHVEHAALVAPLSIAADTHMILVPEGQFIAGSTPEERAAAYDDYQTTSGRDTAREHHWFDGEEERHVVPEQTAFHIDLMPVTQAEFAELVAAGGASPPTVDEALWRAGGYAQDYQTEVARFVWHDGRPPVGREDHPVVLVSWSDADRYCAWRGAQVGKPRRLPTAVEYEKAARGESGLPYPWGNTYDPALLNSAVAGPHDTTPAGAYLRGASPYGVLELAGNVFEWTATPYKPGEMTVKGSAWEDYAGVGRGASRHGRSLGTRHVILGFRCAGPP
jgi:formylglycine-generating enzyme required for sulfatase activity